MIDDFFSNYNESINSDIVKDSYVNVFDFLIDTEYFSIINVDPGLPPSLKITAYDLCERYICELYGP